MAKECIDMDAKLPLCWAGVMELQDPMLLLKLAEECMEVGILPLVGVVVMADDLS